MARRIKSTAIKSLYAVPDNMKGMRVPETKTGRRDAGSIDEDDAASVLKEADKFRNLNERMLTSNK